ncbi:ycgL domain protein [Piscirickettsia salmonis LF-89 = ATCC VR-1361]|nr:ycgL domain protein [Piscirickettsia salmonis LF-89 = ATCC VR-1361]
MGGMEIKCSIFKSLRHHEMYLYIKEGECFDNLPQELIRRFGQSEHVMNLLLNEQRQLARENILDVMETIEKHGFYLQIPPTLSDCVARTIERIELAETTLNKSED